MVSDSVNIARKTYSATTLSPASIRSDAGKLMSENDAPPLFAPGSDGLPSFVPTGRVDVDGVICEQRSRPVPVPLAVQRLELEPEILARARDTPPRRSRGYPASLMTGPAEPYAFPVTRGASRSAISAGWDTWGQWSKGTSIWSVARCAAHCRCASGFMLLSSLQTI